MCHWGFMHVAILNRMFCLFWENAVYREIRCRKMTHWVKPRVSIFTNYRNIPNFTVVLLELQQKGLRFDSWSWLGSFCIKISPCIHEFPSTVQKQGFQIFDKSKLALGVSKSSNVRPSHLFVCDLISVTCPGHIPPFAQWLLELSTSSLQPWTGPTWICNMDGYTVHHSILTGCLSVNWL